ncbi:MAG: 3-phosphoshikimate 1-carboxyvinyltransferase [Phycisphaerales bacterium]
MAPPDPLPITPIPPARWRRIDVSVTPPGSKSLTNRAVLLAALSRGTSRVRRPLLGADDAERMLAAVRALGAKATVLADGDLEIEGVDGRWPVGSEGVRLDLGNAGTATRFLAAAALVADGPVTIDGDARMRERPIGDLAGALESLGARVEWLGTPGCPPLRNVPPDHSAVAPASSSVSFGETMSSQFVSAVLLIAPWLPSGLTVTLPDGATSASYIRMTLGLLDRLGASVQVSGDLRVIRVAPGPGRIADLAHGRPRGLGAFDYTVEPDASGATYFWTAAAILPGARVKVDGLGDAGLQGDAMFPHVLGRMGATVLVSTGHPSAITDREGEFGPASITVRGGDRLRPVLADMGDMPDAVMSLAVACALARGHSVVRGVRTLRVKESDRIAAMRAELAKVGVDVREHPGDEDTITITPPEGGIDCRPDAPRVEFETYRDHRMAMSLSLIGLRRPNVLIRDPGCVGKTYPGFWDDLALLSATD